jgi:hypothetical protein
MRRQDGFSRTQLLEIVLVAIRGWSGVSMGSLAALNRSPRIEEGTSVPTPYDMTQIKAGAMAHPSWCAPRECLAGSLTTTRRHRSKPFELVLHDDACHTQLVTRVMEPVDQPGKMSVEIEVCTDDSDEPHEFLTFTSGDLVQMSRFFLDLVAEAIVGEGSPVEYFVVKSA